MTSKTTRTAQKKRVFKQLSNVEHVRLRTGMWLRQNSLAHYDQHFFTPSANGKVKIHFEELSEIPAKLKCLDEVCMNAVDEYSRNQNDVSLSSHQHITTLHITLHNDGVCKNTNPHFITSCVKKLKHWSSAGIPKLSKTSSAIIKNCL